MRYQSVSPNGEKPVRRLRTYPGKRLLDVCCATIGLLLAFPLMLVIAILVKLTSVGPLFYRSDRCGAWGKPFCMYKFRTMEMFKGSKFTGRDDPRVTVVGKILRTTKLDEIPNLINVLRGEMSIIGPRPEDVDFVKSCYTKEQMRALAARPGLSCLVQVRNFPDLSSQMPDGVDPDEYYKQVILPARLRGDLEYVDNMSLRLDLTIMLQTLYCVLIKSWLIPYRRSRDLG